MAQLQRAGLKIDLVRIPPFTSGASLPYRSAMRRSTIKSAIKTTMPAGLGGSRVLAA